MHLAQVNIARLAHAPTDPKVADFVQGIDKMNALAESSPGFVWRREDAYEADPMLLFNISVWQSIEDLMQFAYRTEHVKFIRRKHEWFTPIETAYLALWWTKENEQPTHQQCLDKLAYLDKHGPSDQAFTFSDRFPRPAE